MRPTAPSRFPTYPAKRVTMLLNINDHAHHGSLMTKLLQRARQAKLRGATVFEGYEGYGSSGRIHRNHLVSNDAPVTVVIIDRPDRIDAFLLDAGDLLEDVLTTVSDVEVVELGSSQKARARRRR
jgi:PII-like signaling protein